MVRVRRATRGMFGTCAGRAWRAGVLAAALLLPLPAPTAQGATSCAAAQELARAGLTSEAKAEYIKLFKSKPALKCARIGARKLAKRDFETAGALLHAGLRTEAFKRIHEGLELSATRSAEVPAEIRRYLTARRTFGQVRALDKRGFHSAAKDLLRTFLATHPRIAGGLPADLRPLKQSHEQSVLDRIATWAEDETDNGKTLLWIAVIVVGGYLIVHELVRRLRRLKKPRVSISEFSGDGSTNNDLAKGFAVELQAKVDTIGVEMGGTRPDLSLPTKPTTSLPASVTTAFPQLKFVDGVLELVDRLIPSRDRLLTGHLHSPTGQGAGASMVISRADNGTILHQVMLRQADYGPVDGSDGAAYEELIPPAVYWFREVTAGSGIDDDAPWRAHALFAAGARLHEAGNLPAARRLYNESLAYSPPVPEALINLGSIEIREGSDPLDVYEIARGVEHVMQGINLQ